MLHRPVLHQAIDAARVVVVRVRVVMEVAATGVVMMVVEVRVVVGEVEG